MRQSLVNYDAMALAIFVEACRHQHSLVISRFVINDHGLRFVRYCGLGFAISVQAQLLLDDLSWQ